MSFATGLRKARLSRGLTQSQLGKLIGVANTTISGYEKGTSEANEDKIRALMDVLKVDANTLFGWEGETEKESLTSKEQKIGRAYGKATPPVKRTVEVALEPYMEVSDEIMPELPDEEMIDMRVYDESAAAGFGNYLSSYDYEMISFPADEIPDRADFGVRINGDSMEPTIENGSIVWVEGMAEVRDGDIGIFILDGDAYCKELRVDVEARRAWLISHNEKYPDKEIGEGDDPRTVGKVLL